MRSEECLASRFNKHFGEHRVSLPDALATRHVLRFCCLFHEMGSKMCQMIFALILKIENKKVFLKLAGCVLETSKDNLKALLGRVAQIVSI